MASGNQGRSQDQGRHRNGGGGAGAGAGGQSSASNVTQRVQEGVQQVGQQFRESYGSARDEMGRRYRRAEGMMARNPAPSVLIGFGIGFGLGLVVTSLLGERHRETWADRYVPDRLRGLPDSLQDSLEQLTESVRNLPDAVKAHLPSSLTRR